MFTFSTAFDYFQKLIDFVYDPRYAMHLRKIAAQYDRDNIPDSIDIQPFIIDNLIFDVYIDRKTLLDHFIAQAQLVLKSSHLKMYQEFRQNVLSCFQITEVAKPGKMVFKNLIDETTYSVIDEEAIKFLQPERYTVARLLPFQDHYVLTGACAIINTDDPNVVIAITRKLKTPPLFFNS